MNLQSFGSSPQLQAMQFRSPSPIAQQGADQKGDAGEVAANFEEVFQGLISSLLAKFFKTGNL